MKLEQSFEVAAPIDRVWDALIDVEKVAPCLPGASVTGRNEDGSYAGNLTIKIGPTTAAYAGRLQMEDVDKDAHTATMQAQGTDKRGQGGAKATITSKLSETPNGTHVDVNTDYHITGRLARFGRGGMIEDISNRLLREFASSLQSSLLDQPAAPVAAQQPAAARQPAGDETAADEPAADETAADEPAAQAPVAGPDASNGATVESAAASSPPASSAAASATAAEPAAGSATASEPGGASASATAESFAPSESSMPFPGATPDPSNAIEGIPLMTSVLWERTKRNPVPLALILGFLLALITLRRRRH